MLKIIEGHNGSDYFWIMPVKIKDMNKNTDNSNNVIECRELEISINEDTIDLFLRPILIECFNDYLPENEARQIGFMNYINPEAYTSFEWNLTYNYFSFDDVKKIINQVEMVKQLLVENKTNEKFAEIEKLVYWLPKYLTGEEYGPINYQGTQEELIESRKKDVLEFYNDFIEYMQNMLKEGEKLGYNLISFMGP